MAFRTEIPVSVKLIAPWCIPGASVPAFGFDVELARSVDDRLKIPGTTLKGVLRSACREIEAELPGLDVGGKPFRVWRENLFGSGGEISAGLARRRALRGSLTFGDLLTKARFERRQGKRFVRVEIDDETGTAEAGHLLFVEAVCSRGEKVTFEGVIGLDSALKTEAVAAVGVLGRAASLLHSIGSMKSSGFGRVSCITFGEPSVIAATVGDVPADDLSLTLEIDRPFIVATRRHGANLIEGDVEIPGGALKAVIAAALEANGSSGDELAALSRTVIRNAREVSLDGFQSLRAPPLSLYTWSNSENDNTAAIQVADALDRRHGVMPNARFEADWKSADKAAVAKYLKTRELDLLDPFKSISALQSRTAIEEGSYTSKFDVETGGSLFAQRAVDPAGRKWLVRLDFSACGNSGLAANVLALMSAGCAGLGKTSAVVKMVGKPMAYAEGGGDPHRAIVLLSDAVLLPQDDNTALRDLEAAYALYFKGHGLELERFYAKHSLAGGYISRQYPPHIGKSRPWLLTRAGSVFLFKPGSETIVSDLTRCGLQPNHANAGDWKKFPYQRENGYGEVMAWAV